MHRFGAYGDYRELPRAKWEPICEDLSKLLIAQALDQVKCVAFVQSSQMLFCHRDQIATCISPKRLHDQIVVDAAIWHPHKKTELQALLIRLYNFVNIWKELKLFGHRSPSLGSCLIPSHALTDADMLADIMRQDAFGVNMPMVLTHKCANVVFTS
jgi:hypothetical protein